ncbi:hypothetical protein [Verrucomicrobium sp. BvORR034]|uniref:hypothetical protein n=1 Tax=Verrucomicrobium sp. BvORR034 TaxID=1396418 RepID=UPI0006786B0E|nr:hypothetical protein [Verrucomicrobium sp. BvORR034]
MKPNHLALRLVALLLSCPAQLLSYFYLLMALLMFGNFNFNKAWHCLVFGATLAAPILSTGGLIAYWRHKTWASFILMLLGVALGATLWMLWTSRLSRGLIH